jgi:hypothetical protein
VFLNAIHDKRVRPATELCACPVMTGVLDTDGVSSWLPPGLPG